MDEKRLADLFAEAAGQPPPPSFDESDVRAQSARVTARHRRRLAGGALAVLLLGGVGTGIGVVAGGGDDGSDDGGGAGSSLAIDSGERAGAGAPGADADAGALARDLPAPQAAQAPPGAAESTPFDKAVPGCGAADAVLVDRLLSSLGSRGVAVLGTAPACDGGLPATVLQVDGGALTLTNGAAPGALQRTRADGTVVSLGTDGPLQAQLRELVDELAR